jgi:hypothetical protein
VIQVILGVDLLRLNQTNPIFFKAGLLKVSNFAANSEIKIVDLQN